MSKKNTGHGVDREKICICGHSKELHDPSSGVCNAYIAPDIVCPCMKYLEKVNTRLWIALPVACVVVGVVAVVATHFLWR